MNIIHSPLDLPIKREHRASHVHQNTLLLYRPSLIVSVIFVFSDP